MLVPSIFEDNFTDDLFNDMFYFPFSSNDWGYKPAKRVQSMNTDVQEFEDSYQIDYELPGFAKEDIQAELKDGYLTVKASKNDSKDEKDKEGKFIRRERSYGECQRSFYVGEDLTQEDIKASFENGVLKLIIPKKQPQPKVEEKHYIAIEG